MNISEKKLRDCACLLIRQIPSECPIDGIKLQEIINMLSKNQRMHQYNIEYDYVKYIRSDSESLTIKLSSKVLFRQIFEVIAVIYELKEKKFKDNQILNKFFKYWGENYNKKEVQKLLKDQRHPYPDKYQICNQKYLIKFYEMRNTDYFSHLNCLVLQADFNHEYIFRSLSIRKESYPYAKILHFDNINQLEPYQISHYQQLIQSCANLKELSINWNRQNLYEALGQLVSSSTQIKRIQIVVHILQSNIEKSNIEKMQSALLGCLNLEQLHIYWNGYRGIFQLKLLPKLCNYESLKKLRIDTLIFKKQEEVDQVLKQQQIPNLFTDISQCSNLVSLFLSFGYYSLESQAGINLGICLGKLKNLKHCFLHLSQNKLKDNGCEGIVEGIINCPSIIELDIQLLNNETELFNITNLLDKLSYSQELSILTCYFNGNNQQHNQYLKVSQLNPNQLQQKFQNLKYYKSYNLNQQDYNGVKIFLQKIAIRLVQVVDHSSIN